LHAAMSFILDTTLASVTTDFLYLMSV
jgi:hypothetical protein